MKSSYDVIVVGDCAAGELGCTDFALYDNGQEKFLRWRWLNANHIRAPHVKTSEGRSVLGTEARRAVLPAAGAMAALSAEIHALLRDHQAILQHSGVF